MSLEDVREQKTSKAVYIIIGLLLVGMAGFGTSQFGLGGGSNKALLETEYAEISIPDYNNAIRYIQQKNPDMPAPQVRSLALASLRQRLALADYIVRYPLAASNESIDEVIKSNPAFFDNGQFSEDAFRRIISVSPDIYRRQVSQELAMQSIQEAIVGSAIVSQAELQPFWDLNNMSRDILVAKIPRQDFEANVDDKEVADYYEAHQADFMTDELVDIEYIDFSPQAISDAIVISDETAAANVDLSRKASYFIFNSKDKAQAAYAAYKAGQSPEQIKTSFSADIDDSGDLGAVAQTADKDSLIPQTAIDAIYALDEVGQLTPPIETENGVMVFSLTDKGQEQPNAQQLAATKKKLQVEQAAPKIATLQEKLNKAVFETAAPTLENIAEQTGLSVNKSGQLSLAGNEGILQLAQVKQAIADGDKTIGKLQDPVIVGDRVIIYRLIGVKAPEQKPLDTVQTQVRQAAVSAKTAQQVAQAGEALLDKAKKEGLKVAAGSDYKTVELADFNGRVSEDSGLDPIAAMLIARQSPLLGNDNARLIYSPTGDAYVYVTTDVRLKKQSGDDKAVAEAKKQLATQIALQTGMSELDHFVQSLTQHTKITDRSAALLSK
ncbi:MAG: hypothetical protein CSA45_04390 [Gammaproteobacteria bacterium]|nr:MAG: hypothetical protein CSA45_04390 [Gammaproteobacteria bacterium]